MSSNTQFLSDSYGSLLDSYGEERSLLWCRSGEALELLRQVALARVAYLLGNVCERAHPFSTATISPVPPAVESHTNEEKDLWHV